MRSKGCFSVQRTFILENEKFRSVYKFGEIFMEDYVADR